MVQSLKQKPILEVLFKRHICICHRSSKKKMKKDDKEKEDRFFSAAIPVALPDPDMIVQASAARREAAGVRGLSKAGHANISRLYFN